MENKITVEFDVPEGYEFDKVTYVLPGELYLDPCSNFKPTPWDTNFVSTLKYILVKKVTPKRRVFEEVVGATKAYPGNFWVRSSGDLSYNNNQFPIDSNEVYKEVFDD